MKSHGDKVLIRPWDTGTMHILFPGLVQRKIISDKALQYGHIKGHKRASVLLLLILNTIILSFIVRSDVSIIPNVSLAIGILIWILYPESWTQMFLVYN